MQTLAQVWAPQLFAVSLFPYLAFLYYLNKGRQASGLPRFTFIGFCFLLVFVFATIPAGIYAKVKYGTSLSNVDLLHGSSESLLTVTNLLIGTIGPQNASRPFKPLVRACFSWTSHGFVHAVAGLRQGIIEAEQEKQAGDQAADRPTDSAAVDEDVKTTK